MVKHELTGRYLKLIDSHTMKDWMFKMQDNGLVLRLKDNVKDCAFSNLEGWELMPEGWTPDNVNNNCLLNLQIW